MHPDERRTVASKKSVVSSKKETARKYHRRSDGVSFELTDCHEKNQYEAPIGLPQQHFFSLEDKLVWGSSGDPGVRLTWSGASREIDGSLLTALPKAETENEGEEEEGKQRIK